MSKPAILLSFPVGARLRERLDAHYTVFGPPPAWEPAAISPEARAVRAVITLGGHRNTAAMLACFPQLGLLTCYGTGHEGVDQAECARRGIAVTHAGDANATSVAEFAMGLVIAAARMLPRGERMLRAGHWRDQRLDRMPLSPGLAGGKLGIYGLGAIGERVAKRAAAFEMEIGYHNRRRRADVPYTYFDSLAGLAEWADVLVVAVRASAENAGAVNAAVLRALGPAGVVVNVSRGSAIDEEALIEALEQGVIAGAGLDVFAREPEVPARLTALENAVLTPHMAAHTKRAQRAQQQVLLETLEAFFAGQPLRTRLPPP